MCKSFLHLRYISTSSIADRSLNIKNSWVYEKKTAKKVGTKGMHIRHSIDENMRMVSKYKKMFSEEKKSNTNERFQTHKVDKD